jgi:WD40 repeat protein
LQASPNSFVYDNLGTNAYLGVDTSNFGQQSLMVFAGSTPTIATSVSGRVLAVSPDQASVILSNTGDSPNKVFVCSGCNASGRAVTPLVITQATAAAFSPDSLKAYILAGNNIFVYSKVDPLKPLSAPTLTTDVIFHPQGSFVYVAGTSGITTYHSCDDTPVAGGDISTSNPVLMLRALGDGSTLLALDPPEITIISTALPADLCGGTITNTPTGINLGQGSFIPTQFIVAPNDSTAYILGVTSLGPPPTRLPFIIAFSLATRTSSLISLSGGAAPLNAAISPDSSLLFVGADDGAVHVIETASGADSGQVTFPFPTNALCFGPGSPATQVPLSQVQIRAAAENGSNTTYSYAAVSGPALQVGQSVTVSQMADGGNNGTFTIAALGSDAAGNATFTVANSNGVSASGQSGLGVVPISCTPDMVAVKP